MQMQLAGIVRFGGQRLGLLHFAILENIGEITIEAVDQFGRRRVIKANDEIMLHESVRMKIAIKILDLLNGRIGAGDDAEKSHFCFGDVTPAHDIFSEKLLPAAPVSSSGDIHQNDGNE